MNAVIAASLSEQDDFDPFAGGEIAQTIPSTEAQREVWLGDQLGPQASLAYNESVLLRLQGPLDAAALQQALDALLARHTVLRASFSPDGSQLIIAAPAPVPLTTQDWRALAPEARAQALAAAGEAAVSQPLPLARGPLFHAHLWRLADEEQVLALVAHHAVCDGWSWGTLTQDLAALYAQARGLGPAPEPARSFADYAHWEAEQAQGGAMQAHSAYWLGRFSGASLPVLELPLDRPRPAVRSFAARQQRHRLDGPLIAALRQAASASGVSLYGALLGGFAALLHRLTAQDDLVIGIAAAGQMAADMPEVVGHCVNTLPLRLAVDGGQPFAELLRTAGGHLLDAFEHQSLTYAALLRQLPVQRDPSRLPLVSVLFNVDTSPPGSLDFPGLRCTQDSLPRVSENFELFVNIVPAEGGGLRVELQYNRALFDDATIARWLQLYEQLLRSGAEAPGTPVDRLDWLQPGHLAQLQALQPAPTPQAGEALMHAGFAAQAAATPERIALCWGDAQMRYGELDALSNRLARALRARGVRRGALVGLHLPRDADMMVALLAVLKAGGAYVPLDPDFPAARLDYYAEDAQLALLLTRSDATGAPTHWCADAAARTLALDTDGDWRRHSDAPLPADADSARPADPAYVIYTSGSTGKPKGVVLPHAAVANFLHSMRAQPGIGPEDRLVAVTTLSFDIAVLELMLPLAVGAQVVIATRDTVLDGAALRALLARHEATLMQATPALWRLLLDSGWTGPQPGAAPLRALVGGEPLPPDLAHALLQAAGEVWNLYGPTETTIWSTLWRVDAAQIGRSGVAIGTPIANTQVWVLDAHQQPLPPGVPGEIYIGGDGLATGYLNRPELTAERFVHAAPGGAPQRLYRTGDKGRWRNDGLLEHMGRLDFQVKVRGYRIELGEIEARCNELPGVGASVVVTREDQPGDVRLVAYLAMADGAALDRAALGRHLRASLPQYMLPQHVVALAALPLLPNGKVDRKALPAPQAEGAPATTGAQAPARAPRNGYESAVLQAMEQILHLPSMHLDDDFFALGGHSLLAARLATQLGQTFGMHIALGTLFQAPTPEGLAAEIARARDAGEAAQIVIARHADADTAPLTLEQQRMRFAEELHPGTTAFNTPSVHRLRGPLQRAGFEQALRMVVARQDVLRTVILPNAHGQDGWTQHIAAELSFELPFEDLRTLPEAEREPALLRRLQARIDEPIASDALPLFRCGLYQLGAQEHAFFFMAHHLVWDGYSFDLLYREMALHYAALAEGRTPAPPPLAVRYGDFAQWQTAWLEGADAERQRQHWRERLAQAPVLQRLPADHALAPGQLGEGRHILVQLPQSLSAALRGIAQAQQLTLNTLLMSAWATALAERIGHGAVGIGTPVRGRMAAALEEVMGYFVGLVPLMLEVRGEQSLLALAAQARQELAQALAHQDLPYQQLLLQASPAQRRAGLYQSVFSFQDTRERPRQWGPLKHEMIMLFQKGLTDDLGLWLLDRHDGLSGFFVYNASLFSARSAQDVLQHFIDILARVADEPQVRVQALSRADLQAGAAAPAPAREAAASANPRAAEAVQAADWTDTQRTLARIWAEVLGIDMAELRPSDNFFDLGGDSLLAMRAARQAQATLGFRVQARRYVFEDLRRIADPALGQALDEAGPAGAARSGLLGRLFGGLGRKP